VAQNYFADQMAALSKLGHVMSLSKMTDAIKNGNLPRDAVAVTFDDGYADNLFCAKPILDYFNIPATVFIISGCLGQMFWWDKLKNLVFQPKILPPKLHLQTNGSTLELRVKSNGTENRRTLLRQLHRHLKRQPKDLQESNLRQLSLQVDADLLITFDWDRTLTENELVDLSSNELIEIGSHSVSHPSLVDLEILEQEKEIAESKSDLEKIIGSSITSFSYPYGLPEDYSTDTVTMVEKIGYKRACNSDIDIIENGTDIFQLPRYWVQNWSGTYFHKRLKRWIGSRQIGSAHE
jgi:peptidoglycan/xylan/chitin deacetylase (PgdA/CDA1 family)